MSSNEERGWDTLHSLGGSARMLDLAKAWESEAETLAPPNDWGESTSDTIWADCLRACARDLRAAVRAEPSAATT